MLLKQGYIDEQLAIQNFKKQKVEYLPSLGTQSDVYLFLVVLFTLSRQIDSWHWKHTKNQFA